MDAWQRYWSQVGNENYLAAKKLLDLSPRVTNHFAAHAHARTDDGGWEVQWDKAIAAVPNSGMSSTEFRLAELVCSLIEPSEVPVPLTYLSLMSSWTEDVLRILVEWATDGHVTTVAR